MKKFTFILILFSFLSFQAQESKKIFYRRGDGKLLIESEYLKMKNGFEEKMKKESPEGKLKEVINDSIANNTIYRNFNLTYVVETITRNEERIETYLNKKFPSYNLPTLNSRELSLQDLEGKPTFLTFWFSHCAPCIKELPALEKLKDKYGDKVNFVAITFDDIETVKSFLRKKEFNYIQIVGAIDFINDIGLNTYPRNILIDKNGIVTSINNEIPYKKKLKKNKQILDFDLSEYERQLDNLL